MRVMQLLHHDILNSLFPESLAYFNYVMLSYARVIVFVLTGIVKSTPIFMCASHALHSYMAMGFGGFLICVKMFCYRI